MQVLTGDQPVYQWSCGLGEWTWYWIYVLNVNTGGYYGTGSASYGWVNSLDNFWNSTHALPAGNYQAWVGFTTRTAVYPSGPIPWIGRWGELLLSRIAFRCCLRVAAGGELVDRFQDELETVSLCPILSISGRNMHRMRTDGKSIEMKSIIGG